MIISDCGFRIAARRALLAGLLVVAGRAWSHEGLDEQIAELTDQIAVHAGKAAAPYYLRRGECYRQHREWAESEADLKKAVSLDPAMDGLDLSRAKFFAEAGQAARAIPCLDRHLRKHPRDERAVALRARSLASLGRNRKAALDFRRAARLNPSVDYYLEGSRAYENAGDKEKALALAGEGLKKLGPVPALRSQWDHLKGKNS